ncbi:hypothetical protein FRC17_009287 [Serendipita sp. 399]|nr:hypothetical protein FRC17_009287 [Serendipita sp. 399]
MKQRRVSPISQLPLELLQEVFLHHVWANKSSPIDLALTSMTWYKAAITTSALWSKIALGNGRTQAVMPYNFSVPGKVPCKDLTSFARAVKRAGRSPLELTIASGTLSFNEEKVKDFENSVDQEWLSRCKSLVWLNISALAGGHFFLRLFSSARYDMLEHLTIWSVTGPIGQEMNAFLQQVEDTAVNLRSLTVTPDKTFNWSIIGLPNYTKLLRRLHTLRVGFSGLWSLPALTHLVELDITLSGSGSQIVFYPPSTLARLTMRENVDTTLLIPSAFASLTDLTLESNQPWNNATSFPPFTSLLSLELRLLFLNLPTFTTPNLHSVILRPFSSTQNTYCKPFTISGIEPKTLLIDRCPNESDLVEIIRQLSEKLESLHIPSRSRQHVLGSQLTSALSTSDKASLAPELVSLTVTSDPPSNEEKQATILSNLNKIARRSEITGKAIDTRFGVFPHFNTSRALAPENKWEGTIQWVGNSEADIQ